MDGIDAVLVDLEADPPELLAADTFEFDETLRGALDTLRQDPDAFPVARLAWLDALLGDRLADSALAIIERAGRTPAEIAAIGSHGQTVLHRVDAEPPHTLQIGDPHRIAERTGIVTVADFRRADVAAGGQGAPLAPLIHDAVLRDDNERRVVINLGGIANLTELTPGEPTRGFDTGPANCFLDLWYRRHHSGRFDRSGAWAAGGRVESAWLDSLLMDPYFAQPAPKSTGIEYFSTRWLEQRLPVWAGQRPQDIQTTLAEFSAVTLTDQVRPLAPDRVLLCGGGVHNTDLCQRITARLPGCPIEATDRYGLPADHVEAALFAWLARERLAGHRLDTGPITGASRPVPLGIVCRP